MIPPPEKVTRSTSGGIPYPDWLGKLMNFFQEKVRKFLHPKDHVLAFWVNNNGNPLGNYNLNIKY